jgi:hypothetical protein
MTMTTPKRGTTFRLDPDVRDRLDQEAAEDRRSANAELQVLLREAFAARDAKRKAQ